MTNRQWLESLSDEDFSSQLNGAYCESMERICFGTCDYRCYKFDKNELTTVWLKQEHQEHKENSDDK